MKIFQPRPWYKTVYIDAFAGTGRIENKKAKQPEYPSLIADLPNEANVIEFLDGSARVALAVEPPFGQYLFIEKSPSKAKELAKIRNDFPDRANRIHIERADANEYLMSWLDTMNTRNTRAVMFLDPFGMQVEWRLLEKIASTKAIDMWLLVPIGMGVNRLMTNNEPPPPEWEERLVAFLGTDDWKERFYPSQTERPQPQFELFEYDQARKKIASYDALSAYFVERLKSIFGDEYVAPNPLTQYNRLNSPMFLLCFASPNKTGVKIANDLLTNKPKRRKKA